MRWLTPSGVKNHSMLNESPPPLETRLSEHHFEMGSTFANDSMQPFDLNESHLATHSCVLGATGSGKSKFLELLMRYLLAAKRGFALIDPHGDLSEDLLAFAAHRKVSRKDSEIANRIHYLEPSFEQVFSFDPFRFRPSKPIPQGLEENAYRAWLRAKADRVAEIFQRKQNQANFEGMPRLQRVLTNVLVATGTAIDPERNRHLPLADALVLLDPRHERHLAVLELVLPHLDPDIASDLCRISACKNDDQRLRETESTINRLRSLLSPIVKAVFSQQVESIDIRSIIQNGEVMLINLRETDYFSADQRTAIGGLFIHEILSAAQNENRQSRRPFHLIIDESADFIGDDVHHALGIMRKFQMSICLAAQDLSSFKKGTLDLRPKVLSQCGTIACFRQSWPEDLDVLSRVLGTGNLSFQKHFNVVDRPDGYDWVNVEEHGENWSTSNSNGTTSSVSRSESTGRNQSTGNSHSRSSSSGTNRSESSSESRSQGNSTHTTRSQGESVSEARRKTESRGFSNGESNNTSKTEGWATSHGESTTRGESSSHSETTGTSESSTNGTSEGKTTSESRTEGHSKSFRKVPLSRHREEFHESPSLLHQVSDQFEAIKQLLHGLQVGHAMVKVRERQDAILIQTAHVDEKWHARDKFKAIERMKEICQKKPYFMVPDFAPSANVNRLVRFLDEAAQHHASGEVPNLEEKDSDKTRHPFA